MSKCVYSSSPFGDADIDARRTRPRPSGPRTATSTSSRTRPRPRPTSATTQPTTSRARRSPQVRSDLGLRRRKQIPIPPRATPTCRATRRPTPTAERETSPSCRRGLGAACPVVDPRKSACAFSAFQPVVPANAAGTWNGCITASADRLGGISEANEAADKATGLDLRSCSSMNRLGACKRPGSLTNWVRVASTGRQVGLSGFHSGSALQAGSTYQGWV